MSRDISVVVAFDEAMGIGKDGRLPWHLPEELKHFKATTTPGIVMMGRKTWESIPEKFKPLPSRLNVVVSNSVEECRARHPDGPMFVNDPEVFIKEYSDDRSNRDRPPLYIIGGGSLYRWAMECNRVNRIIASKILGTHGADTFFPQIGKEWEEVSTEDKGNFVVIEYWRRS
jgi:dihydrofolate reductase